MLADKSTRSLSRRRLTQGAGLALAASLSPFGSMQPSVTAAQDSETQWPTYVAPPAIEGGIASDVEGMPIMYTEPIQEYIKSVETAPGNGGEVSTFQVLWGAPPREAGQNAWLQEANERLNVSLQQTLAASNTYNDKLATTIASGEVADLTFVQDSDPTGLQAIQDGAFADLTDTLAGDNILQWPNLANMGTHAWQVSAKQSRIMGVPNEDPYLSNYPVIRKDLVELAGHDSLGTTTDEFLAVMTDIANLKEAHGKRIWAMSGVGGLEQGMFEAMFHCGTTYQIGDDGKVHHVIEREEFAQAMEFENKLWNAGVIHPDAFSGTTGDLWLNGQAALGYNAYQGFFGANLLNQLSENTPESESEFFLPPTVDGEPIQLQRNDGYWGMVCISARAAQDEERLHELLGILNYWRAPFGSEEALFIHNGIEGVNWEFDENRQIVRLEGDPAANADWAASQWLGVFHSPVYVIPPASEQWAENFRTTVETLISNTKENPIAGLINDQLIRNSGALSQIDEDYRNGIVTGRRPVSDMENYRKDWLSSGGQAVLDEFTRLLDERG